MSKYVKICERFYLHILEKHCIVCEVKTKGEFILNYKRFLFGKVQLDEKILMENNIYHNVEVEYYKIKGNNENTLNDKYEVYGIEIVKKDYLDNETKVENKYIEKVTSNEQIVDNILEKLRNNEVTPVGLEYVIKDLLI